VLKISNLGSGALAWSATTTSWVRLSSKSGTAPSTVAVSINPSGINPPIGFNGYRPGSLSGSIKVSVTGATNTPLTVPAGLIIRYYWTASASSVAGPGRAGRRGVHCADHAPRSGAFRVLADEPPDAGTSAVLAEVLRDFPGRLSTASFSRLGH
jgi:hypothetical protein